MTTEWPPRFIGKESTKLEEVEEGGVLDAGDVYMEYPDPRRDPWNSEIIPALRKTSIQCIASATGLSRRTVQRIRNLQTKPTARNRQLLEAFVKERSRNLKKA